MQAGVGGVREVFTGWRGSPRALSPLAAHGQFSPGISLAHVQIKCQLESSALSHFLGRRQRWRALIIYKGHDRE